MSRFIYTTSMVLFALSSYACALPTYAQEPPQTTAEQKRQPADEFQEALAKGRQLLREGLIDDAIAEFQRAAKLHEDKCAECFQLIGQVYFQLRQLKEAASAFRKAAELKPPNE